MRYRKKWRNLKVERMSRELKEHIEDTLKEQESAREHMRSSMLMTEGICNMAKEFVEYTQTDICQAIEDIKNGDTEYVLQYLTSVKERLNLLWKGLDI